MTRDFLTLSKSTRIHGSVYGENRTVCETALDALVATLVATPCLRSDRNEDREYTSDSSDVFLKLDFDEAYADRLTGISGVLEMKLSMKVQYSGPRWVLQPTLTRTDGTGGYDIPQTVSTVSGSRTIEGYVTGGDRAECEAWAWRHRALLTGDASNNSYQNPPSVNTDYTFVPRVDGIAANGLITGGVQNVQVWGVGFTFSEILPNYPAPA